MYSLTLKIYGTILVSIENQMRKVILNIYSGSAVVREIDPFRGIRVTNILQKNCANLSLHIFHA